MANTDYTAASGTLNFSPGQALAQTVTVTTLGDSLNEANETFTVTLTANLPAGVKLGTAQASGTITDDDLLQAAVESMTQNVPEGGPAKFAVTLTGGTSSAAVVVAYSVAGTATAGTDYASPGGRLTLAPRATSGTITIATRTDDILDPGETLVVTLDSATTAGAATVGSAAATATITQAGSVTLAVPDAAAEEGAAVSFTVTLSGEVASAVKVSYQTASGTEATAADAATDYTAAIGTLTFNPDASLEQTISVATTEDTLHEADETFTLTLTGVDLPAGVEVGDATATGTIEDDDDEPTLALTSVTQSLAEGGGSMTFTVSMDAATGKTATVDYTTVNGTAQAGNDKDYAATSGTLTFSPDGVRQRNIAVRIHQDDLDEDDETFLLRLSNVSNATLTGGGSTLSVTRTIVDDDVLAAAVTEVAKNVTEGNSAKFTVRVTGGKSTASVVVAYTVGGTATAGADYTAPSGTLALAAGAATGTIAITTLTDQALDEGDTLEVRLVSASTATRTVVIDATDAATTSIVDGGAVTVSVADATVAEGATASFKVTLSAVVADPVEVTYETSSGIGAGNAEAGADYPVTSGTLTFSQGGSLEQTIRVSTTQDNLNEANEIFKVTLEGPDLPAGVVLGDAEATGTITDDDPLRVTLRAEAQNVAEGQAANFTVTVRDNTSTADVVVDYTVAGTAEQDVDYTAPDGSLTIRQGKSSGTIAIATLTDDVLDPSETVEVTLTRATTAGRSVTVDTTAAVTTLAEQSTVSVRASTGGEGDVTADEGEPMQFTVNLSGAASIEIEVPYQTANGTAEAGADYAATSGTLIFSPNQTSQTVTVSTFEDQLNEADETFTLTLTEQGLPFGVDLETSSLTGIIADDDPLSVRVRAPSGSVTEGDPVKFTVQFAGGTSTADVLVTYTVTGTAAVGTDYTAPSGSMTIRKTASSGTITIHTIDDRVLEAEDDLSVTLISAASAGTVSVDDTAATATATITDNDEVTVSIRPRGSTSAGRSARAAQTAGGATVREGDAMSFAVDLSGQVAEDVEVTVEYVTKDGTAKAADADYHPSSGTLTFSHSETSNTVTVQTREDKLNEEDETFAITIELAPDNPPGVNLGIDAVTATIIDDDPLQATLSADDEVVREGESATFTVTLSSVPAGVSSTAPVVVTYQVTGTAISGSDYTAPAGTLTIGQGRSSGAITIDTRRDTDPELDETLVVTLASATSAGSVGVDSAAAVTRITDDVTVSAANVTTTEGDSAIVTVKLSDPVASPVVVSYQTASGSGTRGAVEGTDYTANSGRLTFSSNAAGEHTITIVTADDTLNEAAETFTITLALVSPPDGVRLATSTVRGTITDNDPLEAAVAELTQSVAEGERATFEVTVSGATSTADVVVRYSVTGEPMEGLDYTDPGPSVTIPAGAASATITIATLLDGQADANETLVVTLEDARSAGTVTVDTTPARATISEQDPLRVALSPAPESVAEGDPALFEVTLSGGTSTSEVVVDYGVGGTATAGVDYPAPDYRLTIGAGATSGTITIETRLDAVLDPDETLRVELTGASSTTRAVTVVPTPVTTTITDKRTVQVSAADASVAEGALAHFKVTLSDVVESAVEVAYATADDTATAGADYFATNSSVIIPQGTRTGTITVATNRDSLNEADETFTVQLTLQTDLSGLSLDTGSVTGTITDDDPLIVAIGADAASIAEGESATFTVEVTGATSTEDVVITYSTLGSEATAGADYTAPTGTLTLAAGIERGTIMIDTHLDGMPEPSETLVVTLVSATSAGEATLDENRKTATTTIAPVTVTVAAAREGEPLRFEVTLAGEVTSAVAVSYGTSNGTAQAGRDYTAANGSLTFDPQSHERTLTVTVETREDELDEADETFMFTLRDPVNAELGTDPSVVGTIIDDDEQPEITIADAEVIESAGTISFPVTLSAESGRQVAVEYRTEDGTATAGEDYRAVQRTLTIEPGQTRATIRIEVRSDTLDEPDETFEVWLSEPEHVDLPDDAATGTIIDDDAPVAHVWLSRFGRTVATHVMDAVDDRLSAISSASSQVTVAGRRLQPVPAAARSPEVAVAPFRVMEGRELLDGSSFRLSSHAGVEESGGGGKWTAWGRGAVTRLSGEEGEVDLSGNVVTTVLGVDYDWGPVLAGLTLAYSGGGAEYRLSRPQRELGAGDVGSWLLSAHPYARVSVIDGLEVWGLLGYGLGMMSLVEDHADEEHEAGLGLTMGALGVRGTLLSPAATGGFGLVLKSDGFLARMNVEEIAGLPAAEADSSRVRLVAQGSYDAQLGDGSVLVPMVQTGVRYDVGHAEEGFGAEVGGGARFFKPQWGLTVTAHGRFLLAHEASGYGEWGLRASALLNPTQSPYGLSAALSSSWGIPSSGVQRLWSNGAPAHLAAGGDTPGSQLEAQIGYGVSVNALGRHGVLTPYAGLTLGAGDSRGYRLGGRLNLGPSFGLSLEGQRRESAVAAPTHGLTLSGSLRW